MLRKWGLSILAGILAIILAVVPVLYPEDTKAFIFNTFGIQGAQVVPAVFYGFLILAGIIFALIIIGYILERAAIRFFVNMKKLNATTTIKEVTITKEVTIGTLEAYTRGDEQKAKPFTDFLAEARKTIGMVGITLNRAAKEQEDAIENAVKRGVKVTVLVLEPNTSLTERIAKEWNSPGLSTEIEQTLRTLNALRDRLGSHKELLELRTYDHVPNIALTILDDAKIRTSNYLHGVDPNLKITIHLDKDRNDRERILVERYGREYQSIFSISKPLDFRSLSSDARKGEFVAVIDQKRSSYKLGQLVHFRSRYTGNIQNGFFANVVVAPEGTVFPDGNKERWVSDPDTLVNNELEGNLNGFVDYHDRSPIWTFPLDTNYPKGIYKVKMKLFEQPNRQDKNSRKEVKEMTDTFEVT